MLQELRAQLQALADPEKAALSFRFFKAGPGQYGEGDKFLGITVPQRRVVAKACSNLPLSQVEALLASAWHEERAVALFILVSQFKHGDKAQQQVVYRFYMSHTECINNWDLVDSSAEFIVGPWLDGRPEKMKVLTTLADSKLLWERRIAILSTFYDIRHGQPEAALAMCEKLLYDQHDLIQKAVGWMLREIGKRVDRDVLARFLEQYAASMPRTTLRYAIEHFSPEQRAVYLHLKSTPEP
jgi:3-methyladenine DNA glycosylase AlkD